MCFSSEPSSLDTICHREIDQYDPKSQVTSTPTYNDYEMNECDELKGLLDKIY